MQRRNACVVVLGDIGRSPRMQYHALSLLEENFNVDLIGYVETKPLAALTISQPKCKIHELLPFPMINLTTKLKLIFKTIWQTLSLLIALISVRRPNFLLVQNPPGIPTLIVCYFYCTITRAKLIIDWHNYTYTILALGMPNGEQSRITRIAKSVERYFGNKANAHFCVTKAMKDDLQQNWGFSSEEITVLYDRPPVQFHPVDQLKKHELFMKLSKEYSQFLPKCYADLKESGVIESTAFTQKLSNGTIVMKKQRQAILVSSTSWTADEDFGILLKALEEYEKAANEHINTYPAVLCIITGKGPQKDEYVEQISKLNLQKVTIITPWLDIEDYPTVLASADLGVCLHYSSSGLDLPMKVVDMFGCGLPVCAYNFKCLNELVVHGQNGFIFENSHELADQIKFWFENFPQNYSLLDTYERFQRNLHAFQQLRWRENWTSNALPVFNKFI